MRRLVLGLAGVALAATLALAGAAASGGADAVAPVALDGDGMALSGSARGDIERVVAVLADGSTVELELDGERRFAYRADSPEHAARVLRGEDAAHGVLSTIRLDSPGCGAAAGPCASEQGRTGSYALRSRSGATELVEVDPRMLSPVAGRSLTLEGRRYLSARSPGGSTLAVPVARGALVDLVDLDRLQRIAKLELAVGQRAQVRSLEWVSDDRLLAVVQQMSAPYRRQVVSRALVLVDASERRVIARRALRDNATLHGSASADGRLVLLLRPSSRKPTEVTLVVGDANGSARSTRLDLGTRPGAFAGATVVVEPTGRRAFVFPWGMPPSAPRVLVVDLATLRTVAHAIRFRPEAAIRSGLTILPARAVAAGEHRIALDLAWDRRGGVYLLDTRDFVARRVDSRASSFAVQGDTLFTFGPGALFRGTGIRAYSLDGRPLFHAYGTRMFRSVVLVGGYGHAVAATRNGRRVVFDPETGRGLASLPAPQPGFQLVPEPDRRPAREQAGASDPFTTISNQGTPVAVTAEMRRTLVRLNLGRVRTVYLLATRDGRDFYRLGTNRRGATCFAVGRAGELVDATCAKSFPSRAVPVLDFTGIQLSRDGRLRIIREEGIAADGVATVELVDAGGTAVASVPVEQNVYAMPSPPAGAVGLVARAADGGELLRRMYPPRMLGRALGGVSAYGVSLTYPRGWDSAAYRPRGADVSGPMLMVANKPLGMFRRVEDHAAAIRGLGDGKVVILLNEAGAGSFPRARLPLTIARSAIRAAGAIDPDGALAVRNVSVEGRMLQVIVNFGSRPVTEEELRAVNDVLWTLRVAHVPRPAGPPAQHGEADGVTVDVYRNAVAIFRFAPTSRAYRLIAGASVGAGCVNIRTVGGYWNASGVSVEKPFARELAVTLRPRGPRLPYDACQVSSSHGRRWNDVRGNHAAVEIAFNERAERFFAERAVARDLALFVRTPKLDRIRRSLRRGGTAPAAEALVRGFPARRVAAVSSLGERFPTGRIGVWTDRRTVIEVSEWTPGGRRLFVTLRAGHIGRHNVEGLAFVF